MAVLVLCWLAIPSGWAQDAASKSSGDKTVPTPQSMGRTKKSQTKISLSDVTPISTEDAARIAAKDAAQSNSGKKDEKKPDSGIDSVLEFHPSPQVGQAAEKSDAQPREKRTGGKIHGEAYGGLAPGNTGARNEGGAVGATSKSGKTTVYVQGEQTRSNPNPH